MRTAILFLISLMSASILHAQLYFQVQGGYHFPSSTSVIGQSGTLKSNIVNAPYSYKNVEWSYGNGIGAGVTMGYKFTKNLSAEISLSKNNSLTKDWNLYSAYMFYPTDSVNGLKYFNTDDKKFSHHASSVHIIPSLKFELIESKNIIPYVKLGAAILLDPRAKEELHQTLTSKPDGFVYTYTEYNDITREIKFQNTIGYFGAIGSSYSLSKHIYINTELNTQQVFTYNKEANIVTYSHSGHDQLYTLHDYEIHTKYVEEVKSNSTTNSSYTDVQRTKFSFSNIGIQLAIGFRF